MINSNCDTAVRVIMRIAAVSLLTASGVCGATLSDLLGKSTAIVIGTVASRTETLGSIEFDIRTERLLKGNAGAAVHIQHAQPQASSGAAGTFNANFRGIWFLTSTAGQWDVLPVRNGISIDRFFLPALSWPLPTAYAYTASTSLLDALVFEAGAGLAAPGQNSEVLLDVLGNIDDPAVEAVLSAYLYSADSALRAVGLAGRLYRNQPGTLGALVQVWPSLSTEPRRGFVLSALGTFWRDAGPSPVRELGAIIQQIAVGSELRDPAIHALAAMHSAAALPFLAQLLESADLGEQALGAFGLSSYANGCPMQSNQNATNLAYLQCGTPGAYRTEATMRNFAIPGSGPSEIRSAVSFWQQWWGQHGELH
jgi:hypothetical protein